MLLYQSNLQFSVFDYLFDDQSNNNCILEVIRFVTKGWQTIWSDAKIINNVGNMIVMDVVFFEFLSAAAKWDCHGCEISLWLKLIFLEKKLIRFWN
jgi:hypothetical protein